MVARICLPLVSLWTDLRSGWRSSPHAPSLRIDRSQPRTLQQRNDIYGLENDDKMQKSISWSTSRAVPMSCTALEMRCDAENDIQMQVGTAADDEATGAQRDAWSKPWRCLAQPLRPDLSLTTQNKMSLRPYRRFSPSVAAQRRRWWHCLLSPGTQPATLPKSHS